MKEKVLTSEQHGENGVAGVVKVYCNGGGKVLFSTHFKSTGRSMARKRKDAMRTKDNAWVNSNIPSSIVWNTQIHHDWGDRGRMYLVSEGEHRKITKNENKNRNL